MATPPKTAATAGRESSAPASSTVSSSALEADAAEGRVRASLAAVRNLEALLASPRAGGRVLREVVQELPASLADMREAVEGSAEDETGRALTAFFAARTLALEEAVAGASRTRGRDLDARGRLRAERIVRAAAMELEVAADLLDLARRARAPKITDLAASVLARAAVEGAKGLARGEPVRVRLDVDVDAGTVAADARVVGQVLAIGAAHVRAAGAGELALRVARSDGPCAFVLEAATDADLAAEVVVARATALIAPSGLVAGAAAAAIAGRFEVDGARATLTLPRAP